jgi:hypothetical protein
LTTHLENMRGKKSKQRKAMNKNRALACITGCCAMVVACAPETEPLPRGSASAERIQTEPGVWSQVPGVVSTINEMREVMKAKVGENEVAAALQWRPFNARRDLAQAIWYGDMGSPPPSYVVDSLLVSIDGRGLMVPASKTRYLCSQWMSADPRLGLCLRGKDLCVYVNVGEGRKAWSALYVIDPETLALVDHRVETTRSFRKAANLPQ